MGVSVLHRFIDQFMSMGVSVLHRFIDQFMSMGVSVLHHFIDQFMSMGVSVLHHFIDQFMLTILLVQISACTSSLSVVSSFCFLSFLSGVLHMVKICFNLS